MRHSLSVALVLGGVAFLAVAPDLLGATGVPAIVLGPGLAVANEMVGIIRDRGRRMRAVLSTNAAVFVGLDHVNPVADLGLFRSDLAARASKLVEEDRLPEYVPGAADVELDRAVAEGGLVLVTGNALVGKSRSAWEAIRRLGPAPVLLVPDGPRQLVSLLELDPPLWRSWRPTVIWLGDLRRYTAALRPALIQRHVADTGGPSFMTGTARTVIVATVQEREYDALVPDAVARSSGGSVPPVTRVVQRAHHIRIDECGWNMQRAQELYPGVDFSAGIGRALAEAERLLRAYREGADRIGQALVRAAVDWWRLGAGAPSREDLVASLNVHLSGEYASAPSVDRGLEWACDPISSGQQMLRPPTSPGGGFLPSPALIEADAGLTTGLSRREVAEGVLEVAIGRVSAPILLNMAEQALGSRRYDDARDVLEALISRDSADAPTLAEAYLARALLAPETREVDLAKSIELAQGAPDTRASALYNRAVGRAAEGNFAAAEADYTSAIKTVDALPDIRATAYTGRGLLRAEQALVDSRLRGAAERDFTQAIQLPGCFADTYAKAISARGRLREGAGKVEEAVADYGRAVAITEADGDTRACALIDRARLYGLQQQLDLAEADLSLALTFEELEADTVARIHVERGTLRLVHAPSSDETSWYQAAEDDFTRAIEIDSAEVGTRTIAYLHRGILRADHPRRVRGAADAIDDYDFAVALAGEDYDTLAAVHYSRGNWHRRHGNGAFAEADYSSAIRLWGQGADLETVARAHVNRARLHEENGDIDAATSDLGKALELGEIDATTRANALLNRGALYRETDQSDLAERDWLAVLSMEKAASETRFGAFLNLERLLREAERQYDLVALYQQVRRSEDDHLATAAAARLAGVARRAIDQVDVREH